MTAAAAIMSTRPAPEAGFTLLEVLLALTLLAVLMSLLFGGVRFGARVWERGDQTTQDLLDVETAQSLIRRIIERARPRFTFDKEGSDQGILFEGRPDRLTVATPSPAALIAGGMYFARIAARPTANGVQLEFAYHLIDDTGGNTGGEDVLARRVLLDDLAGVEFAYFGSRQYGEPPGWATSWEASSGLTPLLISIRIRFPESDRRQWPDLLVVPYALALGGQ